MLSTSSTSLTFASLHQVLCSPLMFQPRASKSTDVEEEIVDLDESSKPNPIYGQARKSSSFSGFTNMTILLSKLMSSIIVTSPLCLR